MHYSNFIVDGLLLLIVYVGWFEVKDNASYYFTWWRLLRALSLPVSIGALLHAITALNGWALLIWPPMVELAKRSSLFNALLYAVIMLVFFGLFIIFPMIVLLLTNFVIDQFLLREPNKKNNRF